jgi:tubulin monoglycylase TTLL3/8
MHSFPQNAFELYGADFILTEDYQPWLLEINACPGMAPSSLQKAKLCAAVVDDTIKGSQMVLFSRPKAMK